MAATTNTTSRTAHLLELMASGDDAFNARNSTLWTRFTTRT
jgi:hypothetical protein